MPTVNVFYHNQTIEGRLESFIDPLKESVAWDLGRGERKLKPDEVSVRLIKSLAKGMLADVEIDITAAPYRDRVEEQDFICQRVRNLALEHLLEADNVLVWLNLHELGHSWEESS